MMRTTVRHALISALRFILLGSMVLLGFLPAMPAPTASATSQQAIGDEPYSLLVYRAQAGAKYVYSHDVTEYNRQPSVPAANIRMTQLGSWGVAFTPDGRWAFVSNEGEPGSSADPLAKTQNFGPDYITM